MIYLRNNTRKHGRALPLRRIERTAEALLVATGRECPSLSLSFVGDAAMRRINREHRGKDRTTDVLSFPAYDPFTVPQRPQRGEAEVMLGDIVISLDVALRQAAAYDVSLEAEISRLLVHGIAHLLGHDHEDPGERKAMLRDERRFARAIGLAWPYESLRESARAAEGPSR